MSAVNWTRNFYLPLPDLAHTCFLKIHQIWLSIRSGPSVRCSLPLEPVPCRRSGISLSVLPCGRQTRSARGQRVWHALIMRGSSGSPTSKSPPLSVVRLVQAVNYIVVNRNMILAEMPKPKQVPQKS